MPFQAFDAEAEVDIGPPFGRVPLAREALEAEAVINLAKLKTHSQLTLTLGVKNTFGCVVGLKKPEWHMRAGIDKTLFARLIVQIHCTLITTAASAATAASKSAPTEP